jgi:hypothetical protein
MKLHKVAHKADQVEVVIQVNQELAQMDNQFQEQKVKKKNHQLKMQFQIKMLMKWKAIQTKILLKKLNSTPRVKVLETDNLAQVMQWTKQQVVLVEVVQVPLQPQVRQQQQLQLQPQEQPQVPQQELLLVQQDNQVNLDKLQLKMLVQELLLNHQFQQQKNSTT